MDSENQNLTTIDNSTTVDNSTNVDKTNTIENVEKLSNENTIHLSTETHNKLYNLLLDELTELKKLNSEKDSYIQHLKEQLEELETKQNKINNLGILLKLKETLVTKQNEISNELASETQSHENNIVQLTEITNSNKQIFIEDEAPILKPKKKPSVLRRGF